MAHCLDDSKFWLPPHFPIDNNNPFGFGQNPKVAGLSSPVDSLLGSFEGDVDEDQLLAEITRKMGLSEVPPRILSGSPQSTLFPEWDMLCDSAGDSARLRRLRERLYALSRGSAQRSPPVLVSGKSPVSDGRLNRSLLLAHHQLVANQIQQLKERYAMLNQQQRRACANANWETNAKPITGSFHAAQCVGRNPKSAVRPSLSLAGNEWPDLQRQQNRVGTGVLLPGGRPIVKRDCAGTGVFLPRRACGSQPETRKKPDYCATALSDTVIRALNLNQDNLGSQPQHPSHRFNGRLAPDDDCIWNRRKNSVSDPPNRSPRLQQVPNNNEIRLPQEWTY